MTGLSLSTVNRRIESGDFKVVKIGGSVLITVESLWACQIIDE